MEKPEEPPDEGGTRAMDPEIRVMGKLVRILDEIDEPARRRVVAWLADRFKP